MADWRRRGSWGALSFGPDAPYPVISFDGWDDLPPVRVADTERPLADGEFAGPDFVKGRTVQAALLLDGTQPGADMYALVGNLKAATRPGLTQQMLISEPDGSFRQTAARCRRRAIPDPGELEGQAGTAFLEWFCPDPREYSAILQSLSVGLATASGGLAWPLVWPVAWGSSTGGGATVVNAGNAASLPVVRIDGPCVNPAISNVGQSRTVSFALTLGVGDWLIVDFDARTVLLNGTASRYGSLRLAQWWDLPPGSSTIRYAVSSGGGSATLTFRSAYL